ncbi:hypothetical protein GLE_3124 [Lysobacter enzymogenes]|uniref:Uncharacterized protein n=1 Tax=Lysobacter enzymogenes TaxID=69 RepID=A0A0S2DIG0_LYSEN|nr:hypothetical protein GLE_3124 [Lysobacter enzymogenes]
MRWVRRRETHPPSGPRRRASWTSPRHGAEVSGFPRSRE